MGFSFFQKLLGVVVLEAESATFNCDSFQFSN